MNPQLNAAMSTIATNTGSSGHDRSRQRATQGFSGGMAITERVFLAEACSFETERN
jgi:hypothetical protein